jgi:hypothetical protein
MTERSCNLCKELQQTAGAAHFSPVVSAESAVKTVPFAPTPKRASTVLKVYRSPLVVNGEARHQQIPSTRHTACAIINFY